MVLFDTELPSLYNIPVVIFPRLFDNMNLIKVSDLASGLLNLYFNFRYVPMSIGTYTSELFTPQKPFLPVYRNPCH